jgi:CBS domain-containing protein
MLCKDLMKLDVECVSPQTSIRDAARKMRDQNVGFLPVCDEKKRVVGTVTDRDIAIRVMAEDQPGTTPVGAVLTPEVIACRPEDDLDYARELMSRHRKSRIMCISYTGRIEGVISLSDIAQLDEEEGGRTLREVSARESRPHGDGQEWALPI